MRNDFAISYDLKEVYNHIPVHPTMQDLLGIQYQGLLYKYQGMPFGLKGIHSNNEKSDSCYQRNLENSVCDLSRRLIDLTSRSPSIERNHPPDNPISSISRMDCKFRKIEPNSVKSIQIPWMDVEYLGHVSTTSGGEKIQHPSRVEKVSEEDKIQKMYSSQSISQTDRETISYSNPIYPSLSIPQTVIGLSECQSQQRGMEHLCSMGIQNDWRNQMVDENYKNQQTSSYFDQSNLPSSNYNGCLSNIMGSNLSNNKSKRENKFTKRNGEIIARRKESCDPIGKWETVLPHKFDEYQVELYRSDRTEIESEDSEILSNSPEEMVKFYEKTNLKPEGDNSSLLSTSSLPPSDKEIQIQKYNNKNGQYRSDVQHQQEIRGHESIPHSEKNMEIIRKKLLDIKSSTYPWENKCDNRQIKSIGNERRLSIKRKIFQRIQKMWHCYPKVDLFASKKN
jgi:hypothetical protein